MFASSTTRTTGTDFPLAAFSVRAVLRIAVGRCLGFLDGEIKGKTNGRGGVVRHFFAVPFSLSRPHPHFREVALFVFRQGIRVFALFAFRQGIRLAVPLSAFRYANCLPGNG